MRITVEKFNSQNVNVAISRLNFVSNFKIDGGQACLHYPFPYVRVFRVFEQVPHEGVFIKAERVVEIFAKARTRLE